MTAALLGLALFAGAAGCGGHSALTSGDGGVELPDECESFLASYEKSLGALGPENIARARAAQTRASLEAQLRASTEGKARVAKLCVEQKNAWKASARKP